jgi:hypothetical protein
VSHKRGVAGAIEAMAWVIEQEDRGLFDECACNGKTAEQTVRESTGPTAADPGP